MGIAIEESSCFLQALRVAVSRLAWPGDSQWNG